MSTSFPIVIGEKTYQAKPPSFSFQKQHKEDMKKLQAGEMSPDDSQEYMAAYISHCIKRAMPDVNLESLNDDLDAIEIARVSVEIGKQTQKQVAAAYGIENLGEVTAG